MNPDKLTKLQNQVRIGGKVRLFVFVNIKLFENSHT